MKRKREFLPLEQKVWMLLGSCQYQNLEQIARPPPSLFKKYIPLIPLKPLIPKPPLSPQIKNVLGRL